MKCTVGSANLGVWCRCIHSLAQIGDEDIYLTSSDTLLTLSTFNSSLSNFATFLFFKGFFSNYQMTNSEPEKLTVPAKIMLKPYRTLRIMKNFVASEIKFNPNEDFLLVTSEGRSHVTSEYKLGASSTADDIQYDCDPYALRNTLKAEPKVLSSCLSNFTHMKGLTELTLKIHGHKVTLKNSVTDLARKDGSVVTEYNLTAHDFVDYDVHDDIDLTFGFREFKVFTAFAEQLKLPVSIHFQGQMEPVVVIVKTDIFEARLYMATRIRDPFSNPLNSENETPTTSNGRISNVTSQTSTRNSISHEVNRGADIGTMVVSRPATSEAVIEEPPPKRAKRTDFQEPQTSYTDDHHASSPINIGPLVKQMEIRNKSNVYKSIHKAATQPRVTKEEYLRSIPGHDVVLCPDSDEES